MPAPRNSDLVSLLSPYFVRAGDNGLSWGNVKQFGATGDGSTDDTAAIQKAVDQVNSDGGGTLWMPAGEYITSLPIQIKSNVVLMGSGMDTLIHNTANTGTIQDLAILIGHHHPDANASYTTYALSAITRGDETIRTSTAGDASNFSANDMVFIRDSNYIVRGGLQKPFYQETARIVSADGGTGDIVLDHGIGESITSPEIVVVDGEVTKDGLTSYICDRGGLYNMRIRSDSRHFTGRAACYESVIDNIFIDRTNSLLIGNAFARSRVSNVSGYFSRKGLEIKTGAHDTLFENITGFWIDRNNDTSTDVILNVGGESNTRLTARNVRFFMSGRNSGSGLVVVNNTSHIKVEDFFIYAPDETGIGVNIGSPQSSQGKNQHNIVRGEIVASALSQAVRFGFGLVSNTFTVDTGTDIFTASSHGMTDGWTVQVSTEGTLPSPLAAATDYHVINSTTDTFQLSSTSGGPAIDITTIGSGTHTVESNFATTDNIKIDVKVVCSSGGVTVNSGTNYDIQVWTSHDNQVKRESSVFYGWDANGMVLENDQAIQGTETDGSIADLIKMDSDDHIEVGHSAQSGETRISAASFADAVRIAATTGQVIIRADEPLRFNGTMNNSTKDPTTDAPADWVQINIGGTTYYLPAYT